MADLSVKVYRGHGRKPIMPPTPTGGTLAATMADALRAGEQLSRQIPGLAPTHPLYLLDGPMLSALVAKRLANDVDYVSFKAVVDGYLTTPVPSFTVTNITSANPAVITIVEDVPWTGTTSERVYIGGATGAPWSAINKPSAGNSASGWAATKTGTKTFTLSSGGVPFDSTGFPAWGTSGQDIAIFPSDYCNYAFEGGGWILLEEFGLMHQITTAGGATAYSTKAKQWLAYVTDLGTHGIDAPASMDLGFPSRTSVLYLAEAFDWLYDVLTVQERADIITTLNLWYDAAVAMAFLWTGPFWSNYYIGHQLGFGIAGLVTQGDNARAGEITATVRGFFNALAPAAFAVPNGSFAGGAPIEAYVYGANVQKNIAKYMLAIKTATGENILATTDYITRFATNLIYSLKPNRWQVPDEAEYPGSFVGVLQPDIPLFFAYLLDGTTVGAQIQYLYQQVIAASAPQFSINDYSKERLLFGRSGRAATDYSATLPVSRYFYGDHHTMFRTGWGTGDVWITAKHNAWFRSTHQGRIAGHISVQRGNDFLMIYAGQWRGETGVAENGANTNYNMAKGGNTLFHADGGAYSYTGYEYLGGQGYWGDADLQAQETDVAGGYAYAKGNLTSAYYMGSGDSANLTGLTLTQFLRSTITEGSGVVVVFDRVVRTSAGYTDKFLWHFHKQASVSVSGTTVTVALGTSKLFLKVLVPASPTIVQTRDYTSADDTGSVTTHRIEVSAPGAGTAFNALHVIYVGASGLVAMPTTTALTVTPNQHGCVVVDGATTWVHAFSDDGSPQDTATFTVA
jgi:hypothetical protein